MESAKVAAEFRQEDLPNILQLETILWDAWQSLQRQSEDCEAFEAPVTRAQMKNRCRRKTETAEKDRKRRRVERKANPGWKCPHEQCTPKPRRFGQPHGFFAHM